MCFSLLDSAFAANGLKANVRFCPAGAVAQVLRAAIPYGKAVLIWEEGADFDFAKKLRENLREFCPVCVVLGETDKFEGLFSLADDVRAAVGIGERGALAARFFATLRGGYSCAVPLVPAADGLFEPAVPEGAGWDGYPLRTADFIVADGDKMFRRFAEGLARMALAAICAEDLAIDAVFSGERKEADFYTPAKLALAAECSAEGAKKLFCASALFSLARRRTPVFACCEAAEILHKKLLRSAADCRIALLGYFAKRYAQLFKEAEVRAFFVPDYVRRIENCALWSGAEQKKLFRNVCVPTAAESFRRAETFGECRQKLYMSAQMLAEYAERLRSKFCAAGGALPAIGEEALSLAYTYSAELSPLLSPPALEREFGVAGDVKTAQNGKSA